MLRWVVRICLEMITTAPLRLIFVHTLHYLRSWCLNIEDVALLGSWLISAPSNDVSMLTIAALLLIMLLRAAMWSFSNQLLVCSATLVIRPISLILVRWSCATEIERMVHAKDVLTQWLLLHEHHWHDVTVVNPWLLEQLFVSRVAA